MKTPNNKQELAETNRKREAIRETILSIVITAILYGIVCALFGCGPGNSYKPTVYKNGHAYIGSPEPLAVNDYRKVVPTLYPQRDARIVEMLTVFKNYFDSWYAKTAAQQWQQASQLLSVHLAGSFASGFVSVLEDDAEIKSYVITNKHVIADATTVNLVFADGREYHGWEVLYEDDDYDLAVLKSPRNLNSFEWGLIPDSGNPVESQPVVAVGFPAIGNHASYQTTSGQISNRAFEIENDPRRLKYLQHTAPIDPGSSGGPLLNQMNGRVSGVNTAIVRERSNVGIAIPSEALFGVLEKACEFEKTMADPQWRKDSLNQSATRFAGEMSSSYSTSEELSRWISNEFVSSHSEQIINDLNSMGAESLGYFFLEPMATLRSMSVIYLLYFFKSQGNNIQFREINPNDLPLTETIDSPRTFFSAGNQHLEVVWILEHGHWRIARFG